MLWCLLKKRFLPLCNALMKLVMTGLRTSDGIDRARIKKLGDEFDQYLTEEAKPLIEEGKININSEGNFVLMPEYYFYADGIAADLFMTEEAGPEKVEIE